MKNISPLKKGYLKLSKEHKMFYHAYGNPKGIPFIVLHGGPGYHSTKSSLENFNLKKDLVILYDQRGCGKSLPHCSLKHNTTPDLVEDLNKLMNIFNLPKAHLVGGSWGTTLALCFSITYPEKVISLTLRGVFLGRKKDVDAIYYPTKYWTSNQLFKHRYTLEKLQSKFKVKDFVKDTFSLLKKKNTTSMKVAKLWALYEDLLCSDDFDFPDEYSKEDLLMIRAIALIECHYFVNNCFLSSNHILKNASTIKHIPTFIVHGKKDMVCPVYQADELHKALPKSKLFIDPNGGHSISTAKMKDRFIKAINLARMVKS